VSESDKSNVDRVKDVVIYAPLGIIGFVKDNAPAFINIVVAKGRSQSEPEEEIIEEVVLDSYKAKFKHRFDKQASHLTSDLKKSKNIFYSVFGALGFVKDNAKNVEPLLNAKGQKNLHEVKSETKKSFFVFKRAKIEPSIENVEETEESKNIIESMKDLGVSTSKLIIGAGLSIANSAISKIKDVF